jgi:tRNA A-37 threonylcarbamoyl transferase component Bud32
LAKGISSALAYLQERDIVHGDICTENIFFSQSTGGFKIYDQEIYASKLNNDVKVNSQDLSLLEANKNKLLCLPN